MKVTILGSSGQVGAYLTEYLRKKGHEVIEFDKNFDVKHDMTVIPNIKLHGAIHQSDFVFFLAFDVGGSHYLKKYQHTFNFIDNQMSNMSYSPYGVMKRVGELYTRSLNGLIVKFWNVYGIEKDMEKAHVITDFIVKGFETGNIDMMTDGTEEREFLYAEDCCEALETVMEKYSDFTSDNELHITSGISTSILGIARTIQSLFKEIGKEVGVAPSPSKDEVQKDARNVPDPYIRKWWEPKTSITDGIEKVFTEMKKNYD